MGSYVLAFTIDQSEYNVHDAQAVLTVHNTITIVLYKSFDISFDDQSGSTVLLCGSKNCLVGYKKHPA